MEGRKCNYLNSGQILRMLSVEKKEKEKKMKRKREKKKRCDDDVFEMIWFMLGFDMCN